MLQYHDLRYILPLMLLLFVIGIIEMIIATVWTRVAVSSRVVASGLVTFINILLWYYVLTVIVEDISNTSLAITYAAGCAVGTMLVTSFSGASSRGRAFLQHLGFWHSSE